MTTALETKFREFCAAYPHRPPTRTTGTWDQLCALLQVEFGNWLAGQPQGATAGWNPHPSVTNTAENIGDHSGTLNTNAAAAPIGAWHYWHIGGESGPGHVGQDLAGGGTRVGMADVAVAESLGDAIGIQSVAGYTAAKKAVYRGWATNYAGGAHPLPAEDPTLRKTKDAVVNVRALPTTKAAIVGHLAANTTLPVQGYVDAPAPSGQEIEVVDGIGPWYVVPGGYASCSTFTTVDGTALSNLTAQRFPAPPPKPPVQPVVTPPPTQTPAPAPEPPAATDPAPVEPVQDTPTVTSPSSTVTSPSTGTEAPSPAASTDPESSADPLWAYIGACVFAAGAALAAIGHHLEAWVAWLMVHL